MSRALIVVVVAEFVTGADNLHAEVFVGADDVAGTQAADEQHDLTAMETRTVLLDHRIGKSRILGNDLLGAFLDLVVEMAGNGAQRFGDLARSEEVILNPRHTELFFHVAGDVVHRTVAVKDVELGLRGSFEFGDRTVTRPLRDHAEAHFLEQNARRPGVTTDVVVADDGNVIGGEFDRAGLAFHLVEDPVTDRVIRNVVAQRLRHATETFAANRNDGLATVFLGLLLGNRLDIVTDEADRALGLNRDTMVQREELHDFVHDLGKLLIAAEDNVLFLEVRGELHGHERVDARRADVVVTTRGPGILAAADRTMADVDHVLDRTPHHALRTGVGAATDRHHARDGLDVRLDRAILAAFLELVQVLGAVLLALLRISLEGFLNELLIPLLDFFNCFGC